MKDLIINKEVTERAVLVGLVTPEQPEAKATEYLDELAFLGRYGRGRHGEAFSAEGRAA